MNIDCGNMFILLLLIFDISVLASGEDPIKEAMKMLELETIENLRNIEKLLENSNMLEYVDTAKLLTVRESESGDENVDQQEELQVWPEEPRG